MALAVLALGAPDGHVEVVGPVAPLAGGTVTDALVDGDAQPADVRRASLAQLGVTGEIPGDDYGVEIGHGWCGLLLFVELLSRRGSTVPAEAASAYAGASLKGGEFGLAAACGLSCLRSVRGVEPDRHEDLRELAHGVGQH